MSTAADIKRAIRDLLAQIPGGALVPTTTLTADVAAGDTTAAIAPILTTAGVSRIRQGSPLQFHDAAGERATVQSVSANGATLTFTKPVAHDHPATQTYNGETVATSVYTNLMAFSPLEPGPMLVLGDPVITISAKQRRDSQDQAQHAIWPTYAVELYYFRTFNRPPDFQGTDIDWQEQQEDGCTADLDRIATYLLQHQELIGPWTASAAEKFAPLGSSSNLIETMWDWIKPEQADVWLYAGIQRLSVAATGFSV